MKFLFILSLFIGAISISETCSSESRSSRSGYKNITINDLSKAFRTRNVERINETINGLKGTFYQSERPLFMLDVWNDRSDKYPDFSWDVIKRDAVRIEVANFLLQAERNRRIKLDKEEIRSYVMSILLTDDESLKINAISTLGIFDDPEDVQTLIEIANNEKREWVYKAAIRVLAGMCNDRAEPALDKFQDTVKESAKHEHAVSLRNKMKEFKTGWCGSMKRRPPAQ